MMGKSGMSDVLCIYSYDIHCNLMTIATICIMTLASWVQLGGVSWQPQAMRTKTFNNETDPPAQKQQEQQCN